MQAGAQEIVAAAVHIALVQGVAHGVALLGAGAAEGVVAAAGVGADGQHRLAQVGIQHAAGGQVHAVLFAQGALHVIALARVARRIEQCIDRLITFQIKQAQGLPGFYFAEKGFASGDGGAVHRSFRVLVA